MGAIAPESSNSDVIFRRSSAGGGTISWTLDDRRSVEFSSERGTHRGRSSPSTISFDAAGAAVGELDPTAVRAVAGDLPRPADAAGTRRARHYLRRHPRPVRGPPASLRRQRVPAAHQLPLPRRLRRPVGPSTPHRRVHVTRHAEKRKRASWTLHPRNYF